MAKFTDQLNRRIEISSPPKRIISLVPSQTELLYHIGLNEEVVGITKFCFYPEEWFCSKTRIGGTKDVDFNKIKALKPDLIIGNKEENEKEQIEELMKLYPVWMSDIYNLKDALNMIVMIGSVVAKNVEATNLKLTIESKFNQFNQHKPKTSNLKTAYFIWRDPFIVAGHNTFINEMMTMCGLENVFLKGNSRYPEVSGAEIKNANPELILLSSEPYPFKEKHLNEFKQICPDAKIEMVDGELFSWYGARLLHAPDYFNGLMQSIM